MILDDDLVDIARGNIPTSCMERSSSLPMTEMLRLFSSIKAVQQNVRLGRGSMLKDLERIHRYV